MSKIALATAVVVLAVAPLAIGRAEAQSAAAYQPPPGAAPPWGYTTATTEKPPTPTSASAPAAQPPGTDAPDATTPIPVAVTPMQGTTTPRQAVSMRAGPNTGFPVVGTLRPGDQLQILATANHGWVQVASPQGTGWAYGSYLAPADTGPEAQPPAPPGPEVISR
jgi:Bacterial SH3 domain